MIRTRTRARETALKYLYEHDIHQGRDVPAAADYMEHRSVAPESRAFATRLIEGVLASREHLDRRIASVAVNWRLERMAVIDRNVLRIGVWEILNADDIPGEVTINEAVNLAKRYGTQRSGSFVNGILDRILASGEAEAEKGEDDV
jgi:N utilization substance protein B